ncbi:MAG: AAA family ATPase [Planctomycetota bacterium]|nr:AAA family ATPase [Planctomycetota bacterium]
MDQYVEQLRAILRNLDISRDSLPYTQAFDDAHRQFQSETGEEISADEFWRRLSSAGKQGGLGGKKRRRGTPVPKLTSAEKLEVLRLFPDGIGNRDQIPYTRRFDDLHAQFRRRARRKLTKHEFWRAVSSLAKCSRKPKPLFDSAPLGGLPEELVRAINDLNPWWSGNAMRRTEPYRRWAFAECRKRLESGIAPVVAIRGTRQVGKTEIQLQLIDELLNLEQIPPRNILRVQFDDLPSIGAFQDPLLAVVRWYEDNVLKQSINAASNDGETIYLFFDELQNLFAWEAQLKFLVDGRAAKTMVTGSSALRIGRGQDSLAGRLSILELGSLRLREIAGIRGDAVFDPFQTNGAGDLWCSIRFWKDLQQHVSKNRRAILQAFRHFSDFGGYPIIHKATGLDRTDYADQIVSIVVERTLLRDLKAGQFGANRDIRVVEEVLRRVCRYAGQVVRPDAIQQQLDSVFQSGVSKNAVVDALRFLEDSLLLRRIPALEAALRKQSNPDKFCLCDHFLREAALQERVPLSPDELQSCPESILTIAGHIIESAIGYYLFIRPDGHTAFMDAGTR